MSEISSFDAAIGKNPTTLVLGSIPGVASLEAVQYYAHPRNAFWDICEAVFGISRQLPYEERLSLLFESGVGLWDVLARAKREGSLDSAIEKDSIEVNPIDLLLASQPSIQRILLNGGKAAKEFKKHFPSLYQSSTVQIFELPSTSPAYAAMPKNEKNAPLARCF